MKEKISFKKITINLILILILSLFLIIYITNEIIILAKEEENIFFMEQSDTIVRMEKFIKKNDYTTGHIINYANTYENLFMYKEAENAYTSLLEKEDFNKEVKLNLLNLYILQSNFLKAEELALSMLKNQTDSPALYESMALISLIKEDFPNSINNLNSALDLIQDSGEREYLSNFLNLVKNRSSDQVNKNHEIELINFVTYNSFKTELISNFVSSYEYIDNPLFNEYYEYLGRSEFKEQNYKKSIDFFEKVIKSKNFALHDYDIIILSYILNNNLEELKEFTIEYKDNLSEDQVNIINTVVSYFKNQDKLILRDLDKLVDSKKLKFNYFYTFLSAKLYENENELEAARKQYYNFLEAQLIDVTDQEFWMSLQMEALKSLGNIEIKLN